jgi:hypothetical protein
MSKNKKKKLKKKEKHNQLKALNVKINFKKIFIQKNLKFLIFL